MVFRSPQPALSDHRLATVTYERGARDELIFSVIGNARVALESAAIAD